MKTPNTNKTDMQLISKIADRAEGHGYIIRKHRISLLMDLERAHEDCPLDLPALLAASVMDFAHDVAGIRRAINRTTGKLENGFTPRFALNQ